MILASTSGHRQPTVERTGDRKANMRDQLVSPPARPANATLIPTSKWRLDETRVRKSARGGRRLAKPALNPDVVLSWPLHQSGQPANLVRWITRRAFFRRHAKRSKFGCRHR